ncbi:MAG: phytochelatin synthase family protein [Oligoflexia bacterium]|nr:phytochelatin synthase family protein [Oligoflexia bacterium]
MRNSLVSSASLSFIFFTTGLLAAEPANPAGARSGFMPRSMPLVARVPTPTKPKYGADATLLSRAQQYVRENPAPDFWALTPYYAGQLNDASCSLASVAMVVNAARAGRSLGADDELATQLGLLERVKNPAWKRSPGGLVAGVTLEQLGGLVSDGLKAYGLTPLSVEVVHVPDSSPASVRKVRKALTENEKSDSDFIIANFDQQVFTDDASVGHIAPVAAYDAGSRRVLIFDPDRRWYEPYWVSEEVFVRGMATRDFTAGKHRGYVHVRIAR